jgi:hypothetical protein
MSAVPGAERVGIWKGSQGEVEISRCGSAVALVRMAGAAEHGAAPVIEVALSSLFAGGHSLHTFWDLRDLVQYHSNVRVVSTNVLLNNRPRVLSVHTLSNSKIVSMGVAVANLALGGIIENHTTAASFEAALRQLIRV